MFGWTLVRVDGPSMSPLLQSGDFALCRKTGYGRGVQTGDTVWLDHPHYGPMIKCLADQDEMGTFQLFGLSPLSTDRAALGRIATDRIKARLVLRIAQTGGVYRIRAQEAS